MFDVAEERLKRCIEWSHIMAVFYSMERVPISGVTSLRDINGAEAYSLTPMMPCL